MVRAGSAERLRDAHRLVKSLEERTSKYIDEVEHGPFVTSVMAGTFPLDGIRFVHKNHYHLIINDMGNLNLYVAKARDEEEMRFFHFMAAEEKNHLETLFLLTDGLRIGRDELRSSEPNPACLLRTNYFSRLAAYGTPGEIALGILLNFPVWAAGAKNEAKGLRKHYGMGRMVAGKENRMDTDILDRFASATRGFRETAMRIIARDLIDEDAERRMTRVGLWSVEYEAMVWQSYYTEGLKDASSRAGARQQPHPYKGEKKMAGPSGPISDGERVRRTERFVAGLERDLDRYVREVTNGPFARSVARGTFPIEGLRFFVEQTYHLVMNDMGNLSIYVSKARNEREIDYFLFMTVAEKLMLDSLYLLVDAIGIDRAELRRTQPDIGIAHRTNYFTRLALYHSPGEIALAILLNFPVWAGGARRISAGMKKNYGLGSTVDGDKGQEKERRMLDTDVLDRFSRATKGARDLALRIISADLTDEESKTRMRRVGRLAVEYEAMVWANYYTQGLKRTG